MSVRFRVFEARFRSAVDDRSLNAPAGEVSWTEMLAPTLGIDGWGSLTTATSGWLTAIDEGSVVTERVSATVVEWISEISGDRDADILGRDRGRLAEGKREALARRPKVSLRKWPNSVFLVVITWQECRNDSSPD